MRTAMMSSGRRCSVVGLLLVAVAVVPTGVHAERPDIVWMAGGHGGPVTSLAISADGGTLLSSSGDATAKLWRLNDNSLRFTLQGHTRGVTSVALSPDGTTAATGSADQRIRLWKVSDGTLIRTLDVPNVVSSGADPQKLDMMSLWR